MSTDQPDPDDLPDGVRQTLDTLGGALGDLAELDDEQLHETISLMETLGHQQAADVLKSRRGFLKGVSTAGAVGLGAGALSGGAAASTTTQSGDTDVTVVDITDNTYLLAEPGYLGGPAAARSELVSVLGQEDAGVEYRAPDTWERFYWTGSSWEKESANFQSLSTDEARSDKIVGNQRLKSVFEAQQIRRVAGVPEGITVGLSDAGALSATSQITIASENDASSIAAIGDGTEENPYVIKDKDLNNSEASSNPGINWSDTSPGYHIRLLNCDISGYPSNVFLRDSAHLTLQNCRIGATSGAQNGIDTDNITGALTLDRTRVENAGAHGVYFDGLGVYNKFLGTIEIRYSELVDNTERQLNVNAAESATVEHSYAKNSANNAQGAFEIEKTEQPVIKRSKAECTGSNTPSGESFMFTDCTGGQMLECWSPQNSVDDAFETARSPGVEIGHCVGDNCGRSVVDIFANSIGDYGHHVHHIYGDGSNTDGAVEINHTSHAVVHDIYVSMSGGNGIDVDPNTEDCTIIGPAPLASRVDGDPINDAGVNTEILLYDNQAVDDVNGNISANNEEIR